MSSDDDHDDDGGIGLATGGGRAVDGDDVNWQGIQEDEE